MSKSKFLLNELTFGCEIECFYDRDIRYDISELANRFGSRCGSDGSIQPDNSSQSSLEFQTKVYPYTKEGIAEFKGFIQALKDTNHLHVNATCGGHIHIGIKPYTDKMNTGEKVNFTFGLLENFAAIEDSIYAINGGSKRAKGQYAASVKGLLNRMNSSDSNSLMPNYAEHGRYWGLNLTAFAEHKTAEFRIFSGTLDPDVWINNLELAIRFVWRTANKHKFESLSYGNTDTLASMFGIDLSKYVIWHMVLRSPDTAQKIKAIRNKKTYNTKAIKAWKMLSKLMSYESDNLETMEKFYLKFRKMFSNADNMIFSPNTLYMEESGTIWAVQVGNSGIAVNDVSGVKRSFSLTFTTRYTGDINLC